MPKEEWGVKRLCPKCNVRFYDLGRTPITCPNCGNSFNLEMQSGGRGEVLVHDASIKPKPAGADEEDLIEDIEDVEIDGDIDDELLDDDADVSLDEIADVATDKDEE